MEKPTDMTDETFIDFDMEFFDLINKYCRHDAYVDVSLCSYTCKKIAELRNNAIEIIDEWNATEIQKLTNEEEIEVNF